MSTHRCRTCGAVAAALLLAHLAASAQCLQNERQKSRASDHMGFFDLAVDACTASGYAATRLQDTSRGNKLVRLEMSVRHTPFDAEYHWSRRDSAGKERHDLVLSPLAQGDIHMRVRAQHELSQASGSHRTRMQVENRLRLGPLLSTTILSQENNTERRRRGLELAAKGAIPASHLTAQVEYGHWRVRKGSENIANRSRGALRINYAYGATKLQSAYAREVDAANAEHHLYTAAAKLSDLRVGHCHQEAKLEAKLSKSLAGGITHSIGVSGNQKRDGETRSARLELTRSKSGKRRAKLSVKIRRQDALSIESSIESKRGGGSKDAAIRLATQYRF